jgi:hypothetical protein
LRALQQRIEAQSSDIIEQARRIQELEGRLAGTQAQFTRFNQVEQAIRIPRPSWSVWWNAPTKNASPGSASWSVRA